MILRGALASGVLVVLAGCTDEAVLDLFPRQGCSDPGCLDGGTASGGASATHTADTTTGAGGAPSRCGALADRVLITYPDLPARAVPSNEYTPMVLAARPDDTSLLAYKESGAPLLRLVQLGVDGQVERDIRTFDGQEAHALMAHESGGGAFVYIREDPDIYDPDWCRGPDDPSQSICGSMELVRFDETGQSQMQVTLTNKTKVSEPESSFMYYFEHTARIVWADDTYGVYFRSARNRAAASSVDLVSTDTLRFVDSAGTRLTDRGWTSSAVGLAPFGCFYSWSVRLAYSSGRWAAACHADISPNAQRVVIVDQDGQRALTFLDGSNPRKRALGGLVPAGEDFWLDYLEPAGVDEVRLHLTRVTPTPTLEDDRIIEQAQYLDSDYVFRPYMAKYGDDLLLGWKSNGQLVLAVADFETGELVEGPVVTDAPIDDFVEFVSYPGGDVGWANSTSSGEVTVTRVLACNDE